MENLAAEEGSPRDQVTWQLWLLARSGFPKVQLVQTLNLISDISWAPMLVEEQHVAMAALRRHRPEYNTETCCARSLTGAQFAAGSISRRTTVCEGVRRDSEAEGAAAAGFGIGCSICVH